MKTIGILLIDDHEVLRKGLKMLLNAQENFSVLADLGSVEEGINFLENNEVDVLLTDITMPEKNGIELAQEVQERFPKTNVAMLTMHLEDTFILESIEAGAKGYVVKDSGQDEIIKAIETVSQGKLYITGSVSEVLTKSLLKKKEEEKVQEGYQLSSRELQILGHIVNGLSNKMIAPELNISERTVNVHRYNIMKKMEANNTADMVRIAIKHNLVST